MGTTSQKLTYLNDTKTKIRDGINAIGGSLDSDDTFRSYADELESLYNDMPKVSESDVESASLSPTRKGAMSIIYKGNTSQASEPTPSTPVDINVVSGDNTIEICGKNLVVPFSYSRTNNGLDFTYNLDGSITVDKTSTGTAYAIANNDVSTFTTLPAGTYTLSGGTNDIPVRFDDSTGTNIANTTSSTQFTLNQETKGYIQLRIGSGKTFNNVKVYPMIEKGSTATEYEPYQGNSQLISLGVENLLDKDNPNSVASGTTWTITSNGGTITTTSGFTGGIRWNFRAKIGQEYTFKYKQRNSNNLYLYIRTYTDNTYSTIKTTFVNDGTKTDYTITPDSEYLQVRFDSNVAISNILIEELQLEKGTKANSYSEYGKPYIELNKISTYQDYIYRLNDKWYLHKEIEKVVLDGSESWTKSEISSSYTTDRFRTTISDNKIVNQALSNNFIIRTSSAQDREELYSPNGNYVYISINRSRLATDDTTGFQSWLSTHNTIVYYALETPTDTEITDTTLLEQLETIKRSYDGVTNISQENNDLPFILDVSALKEWE